MLALGTNQRQSTHILIAVRLIYPSVERCGNMCNPTEHLVGIDDKIPGLFRGALYLSEGDELQTSISTSLLVLLG